MSERNEPKGKASREREARGPRAAGRRDGATGAGRTRRSDGREEPHAPPRGRPRTAGRSGPKPPARGAKNRNLRMVLEYDGGSFAGWEEREGERTAGGVFREALGRVLGEGVVVISSDRPEPGVHVERMTCNALTSSRLPAARLLADLRAELPDDLGVLSLDEAPDAFHARGLATTHVYRHHVATRPSVFLRGRSWLVEKPIDRKALDAATESLKGLRDLASFCAADLPRRVPTKAKIFHAAWKDAPDQLILRISISHAPPTALQGLAAALVGVGLGAIDARQVGRWLAGPRRGACPKAAPPESFVLDHVEYPDDERIDEKTGRADDRRRDVAEPAQPPSTDEAASSPDELAPAARAALEALRALDPTAETPAAGAQTSPDDAGATAETETRPPEANAPTAPSTDGGEPAADGPVTPSSPDDEQRPDATPDATPVEAERSES